jgi:hypothetical protein
MIVAIDRVDKSCSSMAQYCAAKTFCCSIRGASNLASDHPRLVGVRRLMMRLRALLLVFGALIVAPATVRAVDRGQFEDVPDDIRAWFKGVRSPSGIPCCDISDGHRTIYDVREGGYWVPIDGAWWRVPERAIVRNAGNPLGEAVVWYVSLRGNIEIRCFVPADAS